MAMHLTLREVYEMAEQVERRGLRFYRLAAAAAADESARRLFQTLADMESDHEHVFSAIKTGLLSLPPEGPMERGVAEQLSMIYNEMLNGIEGDMAARFEGKTTREEIISEAIGFEKDSIVFFTELAQANLPPQQQTKIQHIIREELGHLFTLGKELSGRRAAASAQAPGVTAARDAKGKPRMTN